MRIPQFRPVPAFALALLVIPSASRAQAQRDPCDREVDMSMKAAQFPMMGLRFGSPLRFGAYKGWWWANGRNTPCVMNVRVLTAELGMEGAQLDYGILYSKSSKPGYGIPLHVQAALLQTWGDPVKAAKNTTYLGAEAQLQIFYGVRAGYYWPIYGEARAGFFGISGLLGF